MNKEDIVQEMKRKATMLSTPFLRMILNTALLSINKCLVERGTVRIKTFGTFKVVESKVKKINHYNFKTKTNERVNFKGKLKIVFYPSTKIVQLLNERNIIKGDM